MRFQPLSEVELLNLLPDGDYDFLVKAAEDTVSKKSGAPMIKLTLSIWDTNNYERTVFDYIMPAIMRKLKHFADAIGIEDLYEAGGYSANDCVNKSGKCKIITDMKEGSTFDPSNVVKDYIKRDPNSSAPPERLIDKQADTSGFADDVPF